MTASAEVKPSKPKTEDDLRVYVLQQTCDELTKQLNAEINENVRLRSELADLRRMLESNMARV